MYMFIQMFVNIKKGKELAFSTFLRNRQIFSGQNRQLTSNRNLERIQNWRMIEWFGQEGTLKPIHFQSPAMGSDTSNYTRLPRALNIFRNGGATHIFSGMYKVEKLHSEHWDTSTTSITSTLLYSQVISRNGVVKVLTKCFIVVYIETRIQTKCRSEPKMESEFILKCYFRPTD